MADALSTARVRKGRRAAESCAATHITGLLHQSDHDLRHDKQQTDDRQKDHDDLIILHNYRLSSVQIRAVERCVPGSTSRLYCTVIIPRRCGLRKDVAQASATVFPHGMLKSSHGRRMNEIFVTNGAKS